MVLKKGIVLKKRVQRPFWDVHNVSKVSHGSSADLVSHFCGRLTVFRTRIATFLNDQETCSHFSQFVRYSSVVMPLLSQMSMDDSSWWLLDSGASATVLAERFATCYGVPKKSGGHNGDQFKAANGTAVNMSGRAEVGVKVVMVDEWGNQRSQRNAQLKAMVGDIQHNIISTTSLCKAGSIHNCHPSHVQLRQIC